MNTAERLHLVYMRMYNHLGPQHWWPGETPFEVMVGTILTQNTSWNNVEKALLSLKEAGVLSFEAMAALSTKTLAEYIRPAGYFNIKAGRLHNLLTFISNEHGGDLEAFLNLPLDTLRQELLSVKGVGPETADSIILYAANLPIFVVDAYTHRILSRHQIIDEEFGYREIQELFMDNLAADSQLYNEYHALLVRVGKVYCKKTNPACAICPLQEVESLFEGL